MASDKYTTIQANLYSHIQEFTFAYGEDFSFILTEKKPCPQAKSQCKSSILRQTAASL